MQILGDGQGNVVHLFDRECSLQRRHQKVVEEAPVCSIGAEVRQQLWAYSVALGQAASYLGLGTVEFAVTGETAIFLEVNPRLQVEHPVTESVLGMDLVELQVSTVARGQLAVSQDQIPAPKGHAIQVRLYAEDVAQGFMPSTGRIKAFQVGKGVRVDSGIAAGCEISPHYDPMLAKLIAHGSTRQQALLRLEDALFQTSVLGVTSNRGFLLDLLRLPQVAANQIDTETIDQWLLEHPPVAEEPLHVAALMSIWRQNVHRGHAGLGAWSDARLSGWRMRRGLDGEARPDLVMLRYEVSTPSGHWQVGFGPTAADGGWPVRVDDEVFTVQPGQVLADGSFLLAVGKRTLRMHAECLPQRAWADLGDRQLALDIQPAHTAQGGQDGERSGSVAAPMMGLLIAVHVEQGQKVVAGERLATLESMKMEMSITAAVEGVVSWIGCDTGSKVERHQELFRVTEAA